MPQSFVFILNTECIVLIRIIEIKERREMHTEFWQGSPKVRDNLEDTCMDERMMLKRILKIGIGGHGMEVVRRD
jgi:hypothetical protein